MSILKDSFLLSVGDPTLYCFSVESPLLLLRCVTGEKVATVLQLSRIWPFWTELREADPVPSKSAIVQACSYGRKFKPSASQGSIPTAPSPVSGSSASVFPSFLSISLLPWPNVPALGNRPCLYCFPSTLLKNWVLDLA